jgi:glycosyltransferase involved in cell wall biosynthesis
MWTAAANASKMIAWAVMRLSIVIPAYNERAFIREILRRVEQVSLPGIEKEIIVVDDGSTDGTREILREEVETGRRVLFHEANRGKGAAIRTALAEASGDIILIQDADLEYSPGDYPVLLQPILEGDADVVYGTRFKGGGGAQRVLYYWHSVGNRVLTTLSNMLSDLNLTDMETCYKVFRAEVIKGIDLRSERFGFEPEITMKVARKRWRVYEVPISYRGRTYEEGKKIGFRDGVSALWVMVRARFLDRS